MTNLRKKLVASIIVAVIAMMAAIPTLFAAPGDLLGTVTLPGQSLTNVGGTLMPTPLVASGVVYVTTNQGYSTLLIYEPPVGGNGAATLVSTKSLVDGGGFPVTVTCVAHDPLRGVLWGAHGGNGNVYQIALGDPTVSGNALTTLQFNTTPGFFFCDGLAYDAGADTLWLTFDVSQTVPEFGLGLPSANILGALLSTVTPKNAAGAADGSISGVVVGSGNTLYIARDGAAEIRRIDKSTGDFISQFATTSGRVEDLTCDPVTYAPLEAVLAKDAFGGFYEAFEVETGTCPLPGEEEDTRRMTGGGSFGGQQRGAVTFRHGFQLHCDLSQPNRLQINWGKGNKFHLTQLDSATCSDDVSIDEGNPVAGFDTFVGSGVGRMNGVDGFIINFTFTDAGEPGKGVDLAKISITGGPAAAGFLDKGNQQAHP